jgi:predicted glycogen debranching enzyme
MSQWQIEHDADTVTRRLRRAPGDADAAWLLETEWLVGNALGGYASGTVAGVPTRRYHGVLVAALPVHGRTVMLNHLAEQVVFDDGRTLALSGEEREDALDMHIDHLVEFRLELGLPVWRYEFDGIVLEKYLLMQYQQNSTLLGYRLLSGTRTLRLRLTPSIAFRPHDAPTHADGLREYTFATSGAGRYTISADGFSPLRLAVSGARQSFTLHWSTDAALRYRVEAERGYIATQARLRPGCIDTELSPQSPLVTLIASCEEWQAIRAFSPEQALDAERERRRRHLRQIPAARDTTVAELALAADAFIVTPGWRVHDLARGRASGLRFRSVIAGYHWFTDWGRDTMISLEGLALLTQRQQAARDILWMFAEHIRDGLIPNMFPEGREHGLYHTADATLWFFHALDRYLTISGDAALLQHMLPHLRDIVQAHLAGTRFGIGVDPADGLLRQGEQGYQLTWMDAKVGDWVVTPRRGKAVEINALWYNALRLLERWLRASGEDEMVAIEIAQHAERAYAAFNARFWNAERGYLYDVVDAEGGGDDPACRPNQVFAIALRHAVLAPQRWQAVMDVVREKLLTPVGLRSLAPEHPDYKARYFGDLTARDAAYHQGTVWGWLIGPYIDAYLKLHPENRAEARKLLHGLVEHLGAAGLGSISEVFDAEAPYTPRGCIAQAWSVAEVLRCWLLTRDNAESA